MEVGELLEVLVARLNHVGVVEVLIHADEVGSVSLHLVGRLDYEVPSVVLGCRYGLLLVGGDDEPMVGHDIVLVGPLGVDGQRGVGNQSLYLALALHGLLLADFVEVDEKAGCHLGVEVPPHVSAGGGHLHDLPHTEHPPDEVHHRSLSGAGEGDEGGTDGLLDGV